MDSNSNEKNSKIDRLRELNQKLYSKNPDAIRPHRPGILHNKSYDVPEEWVAPDEDMKKKKTFTLPPSVFKKFFFFSVAFFILAVGIAGYILYGGKTSISAQNIEVGILGNAFTNGGEELPLQIEVANKNSAGLELADLLIEYPKGSSGAVDDVTRIRRSLGNIASGKSVSENVSVVLFGEQGSVKEIKAKVEYRINGSNAIFVKETLYKVTINQAPLSIDVDAPTDTTPGQIITLGITTKLNTSKSAQGLLMKIEYPPGFKFMSAEPKPSFGNNIWSLGDLPSGGEKKIKISGTLMGVSGDGRTFHIYAGVADVALQRDIGIIYNSFLHTILLKRPFLEATLLVNGADSDSYTAVSGAMIRGEVRYSNNLPNRLTDVEVRIKLSGAVLDESSISPISGFYDSASDEIIWNKNTENDLSDVAPGDNGRLAFTFKMKSLVTGSNSLIQNPEITTEISIKGTQLGDGIESRTVDGFEKKSIRVNSDLQIFASSLYSIGPFKNTGGIPPRVESETTYTISWKITNSANRITGAVAKTILPSYIRFIKASNSAVTYNETTREVNWNIGEIAPGTGLTREGREIFFQVGFTPSVSQIDNFADLSGTMNLSGVDSFTGSTLEHKRTPVTTRLTNDPSYSTGDDRVVR